MRHSSHYPPLERFPELVDQEQTHSESGGFGTAGQVHRGVWPGGVTGACWSTRSFVRACPFFLLFIFLCFFLIWRGFLGPRLLSNTWSGCPLYSFNLPSKRSLTQTCQPLRHLLCSQGWPPRLLRPGSHSQPLAGTCRIPRRSGTLSVAVPQWFQPDPATNLIRSRWRGGNVNGGMEEEGGKKGLLPR